MQNNSTIPFNHHFRCAQQMIGNPNNQAVMMYLMDEYMFRAMAGEDVLNIPLSVREIAETRNMHRNTVKTAILSLKKTKILLIHDPYFTIDIQRYFSLVYAFYQLETLSDKKQFIDSLENGNDDELKKLGWELNDGQKVLESFFEVVQIYATPGTNLYHPQEKSHEKVEVGGTNLYHPDKECDKTSGTNLYHPDEKNALSGTNLYHLDGKIGVSGTNLYHLDEKCDEIGGTNLYHPQKVCTNFVQSEGLCTNFVQSPNQTSSSNDLLNVLNNPVTPGTDPCNPENTGATLSINPSEAPLTPKTQSYNLEFSKKRNKEKRNKEKTKEKSNKKENKKEIKNKEKNKESLQSLEIVKILNNLNNLRNFKHSKHSEEEFKINKKKDNKLEDLSESLLSIGGKHKKTSKKNDFAPKLASAPFTPVETIEEKTNCQEPSEIDENVFDNPENAPTINYRSSRNKKQHPFIPVSEINNYIASIENCIERIDRIFINQVWEILSELMDDICDEKGNVTGRVEIDGYIFPAERLEKDIILPAMEATFEIIEKGYITAKNGEEIPVTASIIENERKMLDIIDWEKYYNGNTTYFVVSKERFRNIFNTIDVPKSSQEKEETRLSIRKDRGFLEELLKLSKDNDTTSQLTPMEYAIRIFIENYFTIDKDNNKIIDTKYPYLTRDQLAQFRLELVEEFAKDPVEVTFGDFMETLRIDKINMNGALNLRVLMFSCDKVRYWNELHSCPSIMKSYNMLPG